MLTDIAPLDESDHIHYLPDELTPVWVHDCEGELIFFAMMLDGQVTEWVWL